MGNKMDCNVELATGLIMSELDVDTDVVEQVEGVKGYTSGRKFYKLPNWMKEGELIRYTNARNDMLGLVVDCEVLGVIGGNTTGCRFRDDYSIKGNLLVKFSVLYPNEGIHQYYATVATWKKIGNASQKLGDASGCFTIRKLLFTWNHPSPVAPNGYQVQLIEPLWFNKAELFDVEGGWWVR